MKRPSFTTYLKECETLTQALASLAPQLEQAAEILTEALRARRPVLVAGNGGSACDAMHIAGEMVGRFFSERKAANVRALSADPAILTCLSNDYSYEIVFSRQVEAYGAPGGVFLGISTSGRSKNILRAFEEARTQKMRTIGLCGEHTEAFDPLCDVVLSAPSRITPHIQEAHLILYHYLCWQVEEALLAS